eukprot:TRINITY_DN108497_c0_g1_i1.p1 TRINITY_DN108497_c0_g1~~TRINITY_DN108497_c0_g1_i1.p1  ORF type:complete len:176 (-),score=37.18 TRINITY_DN108497_c0_g1_i1:194-688(-)
MSPDRATCFAACIACWIAAVLLSSSCQEDFDADMTEDARTVRMKSCHSITLSIVKGTSNNIEKMAKVYETKMGLTKEEAINHVILTRVMTCYMNIEQSEQDNFMAGGQMSSTNLQDIFGSSRKVPQKPNAASERQWSLLTAVVQEARITSEGTAEVKPEYNEEF